MAVLYHQEHTFKERLAEHMARPFERKATADATDRFSNNRRAYAATEPLWEELRSQAAAIRDNVLDHLDTYLETFIDNASARGMEIHFANDAKEAQEATLEIIRAVGGQRIIKSKSMVSEEVDLNRVLRAADLDVTETDLGEWILQIDDWDHPSHILGPALHKDRKMVNALFEDLGYRGSLDVPEMTGFARKMLREKFLAADVGITGCNYAIADSGTVMIMTNEGNGRMTTTLPETLIVIMGMERILPDFAALDAIMQVFPQSAVGTITSSYRALTNGPRREGETDGPKEVHIIIIDNGRSDILAGPFRSMLRCIRCGACQNVCPVYRQATGQAYGSIYQGPMGIVLTPLLEGYEKAGELAYASTLCGECWEACPVKIPLHELILMHRQRYAAQYGKPAERLIMDGAGVGLAGGRRFAVGLRLAGLGMPLLARGQDHYDERMQLPILKGWTASRDLPLVERETFRAWAARRGMGGDRRDR